MKRFNKQILEAINKGILLALDDYQNVELSNSISQYNDVIDSENVIKNKIEFWKKWVDLGLPSGTRWCKYNLGCDFDLLNNHPENTKPEDWYGDYYMWGDIEPIKVNFETKKCNPKCNWDSYKYAEKTFDNLTKYCPDSKFGNNDYTDDLTLLLPIDDAAYLTFRKYNSNIHIPTTELFEELIKYTKYEYIKNYKVNGKEIDGLNGMEFISKINGQKLFIPAAGYCNDSKSHRVGEYCSAWSSSLDLDDPYLACSLNFCKGYVNPNDSDSRSYGLSVRPVLNLK